MISLKYAKRKIIKGYKSAQYKLFYFLFYYYLTVVFVSYFAVSM